VGGGPKGEKAREREAGALRRRSEILEETLTLIQKGRISKGSSFKKGKKKGGKNGEGKIRGGTTIAGFLSLCREGETLAKKGEDFFQKIEDVWRKEGQKDRREEKKSDLYTKKQAEEFSPYEREKKGGATTEGARRLYQGGGKRGSATKTMLKYSLESLPHSPTDVKVQEKKKGGEKNTTRGGGVYETPLNLPRTVGEECISRGKKGGGRSRKKKKDLKLPCDNGRGKRMMKEPAAVTRRPKRGRQGKTQNELISKLSLGRGRKKKSALWEKKRKAFRINGSLVGREKNILRCAHK